MSAAIFSFFGIIVGASVQYLFTRHLDNQKHRREIRTTAYTDYLKCVSEQANLGKQRQSHEGRELATRTADAKCRICLYGSSSAVGAFAEFERLGAGVRDVLMPQVGVRSRFGLLCTLAASHHVADQILASLLMRYIRHTSCTNCFIK
jgi:hypothetical protein